MNDSEFTVSIGQLVSRIVRLQDPKTDYLFAGDPVSFDAQDLDFMQQDVERRLFLARKNQATSADVEKLTNELKDLETLITFAEQLQTYLIGLAQADIQGRSDSTLVFKHSTHPGDIYQHPDSRIVMYSAYRFAKERYDIDLADWNLPSTTRSENADSSRKQTPNNQPPVPASTSEQAQPIREVRSTESNTLTITLSWLLDVYLEKKQPKWKEIIQDPNLKSSSSVLRAGRLNINAVSKSIASEIEMPGDIARGLRRYVEIARDVNLDQGTIQATLSPDEIKGAYRTLYGLARLILRTLLTNNHKFDELENSPQQVASFITGKFLPPEPLTKDKVTACLSMCWDIVTEMIRDKSPPPKRSPL